MDNLGVPRVGSLNTFAGEYRDSVRVDYRVFDSEGDSLSYRYRYRFDSVWRSNLDLKGQDIDSLMFRVF